MASEGLMAIWRLMYTKEYIVADFKDYMMVKY